MKLTRTATAAIAAAALALPGAAVASHATDVDGPPVSSKNGICHSKPGQAWRSQQWAAGVFYYQAFVETGYLGYAQAAVEHFVYVKAFDTMCAK